jgi:outer membrane protein OmpA-like peptidoglycan-associated protein
MRFHRHAIKLLILLSLVSGSSQGAVLFTPEYGASLHDSQWAFSGGEGRCELRQEIPRFGHVLFHRAIGHELRVELAPKQPVTLQPMCDISVQPPAWKHGVEPKVLGQLEVSKAARMMVVKGEVALGIYQGLEEGMYGRFNCREETEDGRRMVVTLSPVRYRQALPEYLKCVKGVVEQEEKRAARLQAVQKAQLLRFAYNSTRLSTRDREKLKVLADYVREQPDIKQVAIAAHSDRRGSKRVNNRISKKRGLAVRGQLIKMGVPAKKIRVRYYGESKPAVKGKSKKALAGNRRVEISFVR